MVDKISYRINLPESNWRSMPKNRSRLPQSDRDKFEVWKNDGCPYSKQDPRVNRINHNFINDSFDLILDTKTRTIGPAWTRGEIEEPKGVKNMGTWTAAVYTKEQQLRLGVNENGEKLPTTLQELDSSYIGHLQTRDASNNWQTYYSLIPNPQNDSKLLPLLVVTHAQAHNLPGKGTVHIDFSGNTPILNKHKIKLDHFHDMSINDIYDCFMENYKVLMKDFVCTNSEMSTWVMNNEKEKIINYLKQNMNTIYHYHGSNPMCKVVDTNQRVFDLSQVYIGDISVMTSPIPGSTSVSALTTGYRVANKIYFDDFNKKNNADIKKIQLKSNNLDLESNIADIVKIYHKNKNVNIREYMEYINRMSKITACDTIEHLNRNVINKDRVIEVEDDKKSLLLKLDDENDGYCDNSNVKISFENDSLKVELNKGFDSSCNIYLWNKKNEIVNERFREIKDIEVEKSLYHKKRCHTCELIKKNNSNFRELNTTPNVVKSLITSDRRRGEIIYYYLKEDRYNWEWPNIEEKKWTDNERFLVKTAFEQFEQISKLVIKETKIESDAQIIIRKKYRSNMGSQVAGDTVMGNPYYSIINIYYSAYTSHKVRKIIKNYPIGGYVGGWDYITYLHEIGHAFGLGHPHDAWGGSTVMDGVYSFHKTELSESFTGRYKANQFPFTVMSYFDIESKYTSNTFWNGFMKTLGPIDIVAIQLMYGKNEDYNNNNNIYYLNSNKPTLKAKERVTSGGMVLYENEIVIPKNEKEFSSWETIFDTSGVDTIVAFDNSNNPIKDDVVIDLRGSLVKDMYNAGIYLSKNSDSLISSGLMISKGVIVENIIGGDGNDIFYENTYDNIIDGNKGEDTVHMIRTIDNYLIIPKNNRIDIINAVNKEINILKNIENIYFNIFDKKTSKELKEIVYPYKNNGVKITLIKKT